MLQGWQASSATAMFQNEKAERLATFRRFQWQYLAVYLTVMFADWLQGTNMYTLYQSYDVDIGTLFITGFVSAALFGTFIGLYVDSLGRRFGCIVFCLLEILINVLEHFPCFPLLVLGRILGGISTSLLFSAFESWMVTEHRRRGFPEAWLSSTFALASCGNGLVAVMAGLVAQVAADLFGDIGPFKLAIALTVVALLMVLRWPENYSTNVDAAHLSAGAKAAWRCIRADRKVLLLGLSSALYEGATYTFVFMWVPTLQAVTPERLPTGLVFACFMLSITLGGMLFEQLVEILALERAAVLVYAIATVSMLVPVLLPQNLWAIFLAFLGLEVTVGIFFAASSSMRSKYLPGALQASIMNLFRLPLNVIVVTGTKVADWGSPAVVFSVVSGWFLLATVLQMRLAAGGAPDPKPHRQ
eukprot:EG_transcript_11126